MQADKSDSSSAAGDAPGKDERYSDPAVAAFAEWLAVERESIAASEAAEREWCRRSLDAEMRAVLAPATSPRGLIAKLCMVLAVDGGRYNHLLVRQVIAALQNTAPERIAA